MKKAVASSFKSANLVFEKRQAVLDTAVAMDAITPAYRPLHREVRAIEKKIRKIEIHLKQLSIDTSRLDAANTAGKILNDAETARLIEERDHLATMVPGNWKVENAKFVKLQKINNKARKDYRKAMDNGYVPIRELLDVVEGAETLAGMRQDISTLAATFSGITPKEAGNKISAVSKRVGKIEGTRAIKSGLTKVRRAIKSKKPNPVKAQKELDKTLAIFDKELAWRLLAKTELLSDLKSYEASIRNTIGLRQLTRLPHDQALKVASCNAIPRDVSLSF